MQGRPDGGRGRLIWRCRRGMKELDVILERFVRERYASASEQERRAFERLLDLPDPELADYLFGRTIPPEPELASLARALSGDRA